jgi:CRP-like cAMP-binding protein
MFNALSEREYASVIQYCRLPQFSRGEMIFKKGAPCAEFHVLISGRVKLYVVSASGQEKVVELVEPGQSFAEACMFLENSYMLNAQALTSTLLMTIDKQAMLGEIARDHRFSVHLLATISHRIQRLLQDVESYTLNSGMRRLIDYLLTDLKGAHNSIKGVVSVCLPASKRIIASRLSLTPEYFSRVLHELESVGVIEVHKREIRILDTHRLGAYEGLNSVPQS